VPSGPKTRRLRMSESLWVSFLVFFEGGGCRLGRFEVSVIRGLDFCGGAVAELGVQSLVVEPPHPFQHCELDLCLHMEVTMGENARAHGVPDNVREPIDKSFGVAQGGHRDGEEYDT
jgi:hypothetical protein